MSAPAPLGWVVVVLRREDDRRLVSGLMHADHDDAERAAERLRSSLGTYYTMVGVCPVLPA